MRRFRDAACASLKHPSSPRWRPLGEQLPLPLRLPFLISLLLLAHGYLDHADRVWGQDRGFAQDAPSDRSRAAQPTQPTLRAVSSRVTLALDGSKHFVPFLRSEYRQKCSCTVESGASTIAACEPTLEFEKGYALAFLEVTPEQVGQVTVTVRAPDHPPATVTIEVVAQGVAPTAEILTPTQGAVLSSTFQFVGRGPRGAKLELLIGDEVVATLAPQMSSRSGHPKHIVGYTVESARIETLLGADRDSQVAHIAIRATLADGMTSTQRIPVLLSRRLQAAPGDVIVEAEQLLVSRQQTAASGEVFARLSGSNDSVVLAVEAEVPSYYQLYLAARGPESLPLSSIHVFLDNNTFNGPITIGPLASHSAFKEYSLGSPLLVPQGKHQIRLNVANSGDRDAVYCDIDRVELRHLGARSPDVVPPRALLTLPADGSEVGEIVDVYGTSRDDLGRVIATELEVDGKVGFRSDGPQLIHRLSGLQPGSHRLRLIAVDASGNRGYSAPISLQRLPYQGHAPATRHVYVRSALGVSQAPPGVSNDMGGIQLRTDLAAPGSQAFRVQSDGTPIRFECEAERSGYYQIALQARCDSIDETAVAELGVTQGGSEVCQSRALITEAQFTESRAAKIELFEGTNVISITNAKGTPFELAGFHLWEMEKDEEAPWAQIVVREGPLYIGDVVAVRCSDNSDIELVELLVDGKVVSRSGHAGLTGLWLHATQVTPGEHRLQARATDRFGQQGLSSELEVAIEPAPVDELTATELTVHLMQRLGLGYRRDQLVQILLQGPHAWLEQQLAANPESDVIALFIDRELMKNNTNNVPRMRESVAGRMIFTRLPVRERIAEFFDNHFSTFLGKSGLLSEWHENHRFRNHALGRFSDVLWASATSPAMLSYLDNTQNQKGQLNENYAREILELHTLGVDAGYTQQDVEQVARIFTGWTTAEGFPRLEWATFTELNDSGLKQALGCTFEEGSESVIHGERLLGILSNHPATSQFVAAKLVRCLVADEPPPALVDRVAKRFLETGGDIPELLRCIVNSKEFNSRENFCSKVRDPLEQMLAFARQGIIGFDLPSLAESVSSMGRPLFGRVTPDGYPEAGEDWLNAAVLMERWNFAEFISRRLRLDLLVGPYNVGRKLESWVDDLEMTMLGRPLSQQSREALLEAFPEWIEDEDSVRAICALLLQLPEAQKN